MYHHMRMDFCFNLIIIRRPGQLFEILELYPSKDGMPDWRFQDLELKLRVGVLRGFRTKPENISPLFAYLKHLSLFQKLHFSTEHLTNSSDPEINKIFQKGNLLTWDCPKNKLECMMNSLTLLGFIWSHRDNINLHFGQLLHAIWPENPKVPVGWNTYVEEFETDLLLTTLSLYWNCYSPMVAHFTRKTYSLNRVKGEHIYQFVKNENPENLTVIVGKIQELSSTEMTVAYKSDLTQVTLKNSLPTEMQRFIQGLGSHSVFVKVNGHIKEDNSMVDATIMDILAVPKNRFD